MQRTEFFFLLWRFLMCCFSPPLLNFLPVSPGGCFGCLRVPPTGSHQLLTRESFYSPSPSHSLSSPPPTNPIHSSFPLFTPSSPRPHSTSSHILLFRLCYLLLLPSLKAFCIFSILHRSVLLFQQLVTVLLIKSDICQNNFGPLEGSVCKNPSVRHRPLLPWQHFFTTFPEGHIMVRFARRRVRVVSVARLPTNYGTLGNPMTR